MLNEKALLLLIWQPMLLVSLIILLRYVHTSILEAIVKGDPEATSEGFLWEFKDDKPPDKGGPEKEEPKEEKKGTHGSMISIYLSISRLSSKSSSRTPSTFPYP